MNIFPRMIKRLFGGAPTAQGSYTRPDLPRPGITEDPVMLDGIAGSQDMPMRTTKLSRGLMAICLIKKLEDEVDPATASPVVKEVLDIWKRYNA
jgi:hypothetical protein